MNTAKNTTKTETVAAGIRKPLSLMVGIPTCYGDPSILKVVEKILASRNTVIDRFVIISDSIPLPDTVQTRLRELGIELCWNDEAGSWMEKIKQMVDMCDTDILVLTQDDIIFEPDTISAIAREFEKNYEITMVTSMVKPLPPKTFVENIVSEAVLIPFHITTQWKGGDNYLSASGRCLSFRTGFAKGFHFPKEIVSGDAFLYFENKQFGGRMVQATDSIVYVRAPQTISDQVGPSSRYQVQQEELSQYSKYFNFDLASEYRMPFTLIFYAVLVELMHHPINTLLYFPLFAYTRLFCKSRLEALNPMWKADKSAKNIL